MLNQDLVGLGKKRSTIREIFEYGNARAKEIGRENIFDFSIGNPSVPAPDAVRRTLLSLVENTDPVALHGYTSAQGAEPVRAKIAESLNRRFGTAYHAGSLYMTVGAAAAISICFKALTCSPEDEFIVFAPFFPEYSVFIEKGAGAKCVIVPPRIEDFQIDFDAFARCLSPRTQAVVVNSPSNPAGAAYSAETLTRLSALLQEKSAEYGHTIYLISDEPYREIVYDGIALPCPARFYPATLMCYSYSKSLSLPGERIGYVAVPDVPEFIDLYAAVCGAGRVLGYVNAPSLFQLAAAECAGETADLSVYAENRRLLYEGLTAMGYRCVKPDGAFYLFPQTLEPDDRAFCERAKKYELLLVPGADFGAPGHMRISYCVQTGQIRRALPLFQKLAEEYQ